jgi:SAM-dependent methyltransferase
MSISVIAPPRDRDCARDAYEALAPVYDGLTAHHDYDRWLSILEGLAAEHGLGGRRMLDVACGTGKSFMPLARRGYQVEACDISPSMARQAQAKSAGLGVTVTVADMRRLPVPARPFDLVTCLDDAVNYLLTREDMVAALAGMRRSLRPGGVLVFDGNTLASYRAVYCSRASWAGGGETYVSLGLPQPVAESALFETTLEAWRGPEGTGTLLSSSRHVQRHWGVAELESCLAEAGLECAAVYGSEPDGTPTQPADEERHVKTVVVARRPQGGKWSWEEVNTNAEDREDGAADRARHDVPEGLLRPMTADAEAERCS